MRVFISRVCDLFVWSLTTRFVNLCIIYSCTNNDVYFGQKLLTHFASAMGIVSNFWLIFLFNKLIITSSIGLLKNYIDQPINMNGVISNQSKWLGCCLAIKIFTSLPTPPPPLPMFPSGECCNTFEENIYRCFIFFVFFFTVMNLIKFHLVIITITVYFKGVWTTW